MYSSSIPPNEQLDAFRNGEESGFDFFFRKYYPSLVIFCTRIIRSQPPAEEIAGDCFIKLWDRHPAFSSEAHIRSFLYAVARNRCIDWLRQQKLTRANETEMAAATEDTVANILVHMVRAETYREIQEAVKTLPPRCRQIFTMLYFEGKNYKEIAEELKLSLDTIRVQKARALLLIRQKISLSIVLFFPFLI